MTVSAHRPSSRASRTLEPFVLPRALRRIFCTPRLACPAPSRWCIALCSRCTATSQSDRLATMATDTTDSDADREYHAARCHGGRSPSRPQSRSALRARALPTTFGRPHAAPAQLTASVRPRATREGVLCPLSPASRSRPAHPAGHSGPRALLTARLQAARRFIPRRRLRDGQYSCKTQARTYYGTFDTARVRPSRGHARLTLPTPSFLSLRNSRSVASFAPRPRAPAAHPARPALLDPDARPTHRSGTARGSPSRSRTTS